MRNKIALEQVYLSNWYGFIDEFIPIDGSNTFITGENESGKSTIIDAVKYAFMDDTQFNKGAETKGYKKRTLPSYTRCLYNPSEGKYARNEATVYSYIFLGWNNEETNERFVTGCIITTSKDNVAGATWYIIDKDIKELIFTKMDGGKKYILSPGEFKNQNFLNVSAAPNYSVFSTWDSAQGEFMMKLGLLMSPSTFLGYRDKVRHCLNYNPNSNMVDFVNEYVLKENNIDTQNLITARKKYTDLKKNMDRLIEEADLLENIRDMHAKYTAAMEAEAVNDFKCMYQELHTLQQSESDEQKIAEDTERLLGDYERKKDEKEKESEKIKREIDDLKASIGSNDNEKRLRAVKQEITELESQMKALSGQKERLEAVECMFDNHLPDFQPEKTDSRESCFQKKRNELKKKKSETEQEIYRFATQKEDVKRNIRGLTAEILSLKNSTPVYVNSDAVKLRDEINKVKKGAAALLCEYVISIRDETWRDALESYIGKDRYAVIVSPADFELACGIQKKLKLKEARLVNTKKLYEKEYEAKKGSLAELLVVENETALRFLAFSIGNVMQADSENVVNYDRAISKDLRSSGRMMIGYRHKAMENCLGFEALKLNLNMKETQLKQLEETLADAENTLKKNQKINSELERIIDLSGKDYNFHVDKDIESMKEKIAGANEEKSRMELAIQKDGNFAFVQVYESLNRLEFKEKELKKEIDKITREIGRLAEQKKRTEAETQKIKKQIEEKEEEIKEKKQRNELYAEKALEEIEQGKTRTVNKDYLRNKVSEFTKSLIIAKSDYATKTGVQVVEGNDISYYMERLNFIKMSDIEKAKNEISKEQERLSEIFQNEFLGAIYNNTESARTSLKKINRSLMKMKFNTQYQFTSEYLNDGSDYEIIIRYAKYMHDNQDEITIFNYGSQEAAEESENVKLLNERMEKILDKICNDNENREIIEKLSDYRNYMKYDIRILDKTTGETGLLSKQMGYDSGAGAQIPYTVILAVALAMEYDKEQDRTSIRLMMMDEPFEKMSSENVKKMMELFDELNLQVIFCGASKMESIGEKCGVIVPVLKISKQHMTTGSVEFKTGESKWKN